MNVMVVDDEPIVRLGLRTMVNWEDHGLSLAAEAADGVEALEIMARTPVDLLITDLRMPRMDGLELIKRAKAQYQDLGILVLSCLDDFVLVKETMKMGASDYILKPTMEPDTLLQSVLQLKQSILSERREKQKLEEWRKQLLHSQSFRAGILLRKFALEGHWDPELEAHLFGDGDKVMTLWVTGLSIKDDSWETGEEIDEHVQLLAEAEWDAASRLFVYRAPATHSVQESHSLLYRLAVRWERRLKQEEGVGQKASVGIGLVASGKEQLAAALWKHEQQCRSHYYGKAGTLQDEVSGCDPNQGEDLFPYEERMDLLRAISGANEEAIFHHAVRMLDRLKQSEPPIGKLHHFIFETMGLTVGYARESGSYDLADFERKCVSLEAVRSCSSMAELEEWVMQAYRLLWENRYGRMPERNVFNPFIKKALYFMQTNYHQPIGTTDIAEYVRLSRSYLSDLFSKEMGESLTETLTRIRIEEAKKRLRTGEKKVYEVAKEVGFTDPKTFAKTFKRMVGCTPKEYDQQHRAN